MNAKNSYIYILISIFIVATHFIIYESGITKNFDYKIYDFSKEFVDSDKIANSESNVVIVDIDEKSLSHIGQWPWPRMILAQLIDDIDSYKPTAIALDIIFPERDRTSPSEIVSFYKNYLNIDTKITGIPKELEDNDEILSQALKNSNSILSIYLSEKKISNNLCECSHSLDIKNSFASLKSYPYVLCNIDKLFYGLNGFGFINTKVDEDGILRRYSLVKKKGGNFVPSLSLATLLSIDSRMKDLNNNTLEIMNHRVVADKNANVLLNYYDSKWYKKVSAVDVLSKRVKRSDLVGKIILLGSSAIALHDQVVVAKGRTVAGVQVQATVIDNLLHDDLLVQPQYFKPLNIFISLFLIFTLFFLLLKKENNFIVELFVGVIILSAVINIYALSQGLYISIGYLLIPFLVHFFLISIIFIFIDTYDRKVFSEELNRSHVALLDSMVHVAEVHDLETGAHIVRTKNYIKLLAEYIYSKGIYEDQLSKEIISMMYLTASMHDIGKVGIPDSILKKEGKLTPMEYEVMKTHSELGKHIINNAISSYHMNDFFMMARNIAQYHHEKWDGSGYPSGLKGSEIPLASRFMAIADVYDALVSKRVYKEPFSYEKTLKIIADSRGSHFDPVLVDAFMEISDKFKEIAEKYRD